MRKAPTLAVKSVLEFVSEGVEIVLVVTLFGAGVFKQNDAAQGYKKLRTRVRRDAGL